MLPLMNKSMLPLEPSRLNYPKESRFIYDNFLIELVILWLFVIQGLWAVVNNAGFSTFGEVEWVPLTTYEMVP